MKPRIELNKIRKNDYYRYLFLEYKGRDLNELKYKTCIEIGINSNSELILKFIEPNFKEKNKFYFKNVKEDIKEMIDEQKKDKNYKIKKDDNENVKSKMNKNNKYHNYQKFSSSDNNPKINVVFDLTQTSDLEFFQIKNQKVDVKCNLIIEADKSV